MDVVDRKYLGITFGAIIDTGDSNAIGAAVVFFPKLVKLASRQSLAASLGFTAGVMTYVSFVNFSEERRRIYQPCDRHRVY